VVAFIVSHKCRSLAKAKFTEKKTAKLFAKSWTMQPWYV